ncbi:MAG TPA: 2,3-bisphosphoglycerate-independent phosphoglycerate mutase [Candidatus Eisenbacteria bacterium]|nr:2,3-bisphosphoglycerate-independent phosphoglycerate mutase [Candidatus Eisenbacteria bacterium]
MTKRPKPIVLTVLDGWGYRAETEGNAIALARKPTYDHLVQNFANTLIATSGPAVGLPDGQMGNSEVGHMNIGAGRVVRMDITKIDVLVANKSLGEVPLFQQAMEHGRQRQLHFLGLLSDGGVHSHIQHLFGLLELAKQHKVENVFVHCFMDGRDTPPHSGRDFIQQLQQKMRELGVGKIATVVGRYYAMDRDNRWERIQLAYNALVHGQARHQNLSPVAALEESYQRGVTDEFVEPVVITQEARHGQSAAPVGTIRDNDAVIFFNFRADRARQMTYALAGPEFDKFADPQRPKNLFYVAMTQYDKNWLWLQSVIKPDKLEHILAQVFADLNYKNLRTAETEKYAHVTYFFNGGVEKPFSGEERILVPSPKVATYDLKPEMSAEGITDTVVKAIEKGEFDAIIMNYANADMVGHSGKLEAAIKAVETVDAGLAKIFRTLKPRGGAWIITADHGNAETMIDPLTGGPHTYHTTNPVPFVLVTENEKLKLKSGGALRDIAPTLLGLLGQHCPAEMTGSDLRIVAK